MERLLKYMTKLFTTMQEVFSVLGELTPDAWRKYKPAEAFTKWVDGLPASYTVRWADELPDATNGITPEMMRELRMSPAEAAARMAQRAADEANVWAGVEPMPDGGAAAVKEQVAKEAAAQRAKAREYEAAKKRHAQAIELGLPGSPGQCSHTRAVGRRDQEGQEESRAIQCGQSGVGETPRPRSRTAQAGQY
jgi:hypothetical protein